MSFSGLPDPRHQEFNRSDKSLTLAVNCRAWKHIRKRHLRNQNEEWVQVLWPELVNALQRGEGQDCQSPCAQESLRTIGARIREAMEHPLVIVLHFESVRKRRRRGYRGECFIAVLQSGATAIGYFFAPRQTADLITCYMPESSRVSIRRNRPRWRKVATKLIRRYCVFSEDASALLHPTPDHSVQRPDSGGKTRYERNIRFITPSSWGFAPEKKGQRWRGRYQSWQYS